MNTATCNTCCRPANAPFRVFSPEGKVMVGCVDAAHTEHLSGMISASAAWHFRPEAKRVRTALERFRR